MTETEQKRDGVYAWIRSTQHPKASIFLPVPQEDAGKQESTPLSWGRVPLCMGMLGIISGGVDGSEPFAYAVSREAFEERSLSVPLTSISNSLPSIPVRQLRKEGDVTFNVHGHTMVLDSSHLERLQGLTPVVFVGDEALARFLQEERSRLRPSVYLAGMRILQQHILQRI